MVRGRYGQGLGDIRYRCIVEAGDGGMYYEKFVFVM